jgi:hypothetical protein
VVRESAWAEAASTAQRRSHKLDSSDSPLNTEDIDI